MFVKGDLRGESAEQRGAKFASKYRRRSLLHNAEHGE